MNTTIPPGSSTSLQGSSDLVTHQQQPLSPSGSPSQGVETELQAPALSVQELSGIVDGLNDTMAQMKRDLNFELDTDSEELVIRVTDKQTGELIRQIPSEDTLKLKQHIEGMSTILFETQA